MPDLTTHVAVARLAREIPVVRRWLAAGSPEPARAALACYYLGALLPDLVTRPLHILVPSLSSHVHVFHSPVCVVLWTIVATALFAPSLRAMAFRTLLAGAATHVAVDLVQRHVAGGYYVWFPVSLDRTTAGLLWSDQVVLLAPAVVTLALLVHLWARRRASAPRAR